MDTIVLNVVRNRTNNTGKTMIFAHHMVCVAYAGKTNSFREQHTVKVVHRKAMNTAESGMKRILNMSEKRTGSVVRKDITSAKNKASVQNAVREKLIMARLNVKSALIKMH